MGGCDTHDVGLRESTGLSFHLLSDSTTKTSVKMVSFVSISVTSCCQNAKKFSETLIDLSNHQLNPPLSSVKIYDVLYKSFPHKNSHHDIPFFSVHNFKLCMYLFSQNATMLIIHANLNSAILQYTLVYLHVHETAGFQMIPNTNMIPNPNPSVASAHERVRTKFRE